MSSTQASRYNFQVPVGDETILYNARTGAALELEGADARILAGLLCTQTSELDEDVLPADTRNALLGGGFLVPENVDELAEIRALYWRARGETPLVLTLTTTMECNLGCYYCYEERSGHELRNADVDPIVELVRNRLRESGKRSLHVDWYGGEPLLNIEFIEDASTALQAACLEDGVAYSASVISNGTRWPNTVDAFVSRHRIRQVQISFDGMRKHHDRRRRFRRGYEASPGESSFDRAVALVDTLLGSTRVDIRINLDRGNRGDLALFLRMVQERGWLNRDHRAVVQPARLASYSERSAFMRNCELSVEEYDELRALTQKTLGAEHVEESETPDGYPFPRTSVCAALATDSVVVGADGLQYRCGLQVGETQRAVGTIRPDEDQEYADTSWWREFDPTTLQNCSRCSFLPICWGGCPKKHLEGDEHALEEQSLYWRRNLPRLVAAKVGKVPPEGFQFTETDQFR